MKKLKPKLSLTRLPAAIYEYCLDSDKPNAYCAVIEYNCKISLAVIKWDEDDCMDGSGRMSALERLVEWRDENYRTYDRYQQIEQAA